MQEVQKWFEKHVSLHGEPYFLDKEQAAAVCDSHKNTLVTARAGSGKTRIIVAKIAYLIHQEGIKPAEISAFVFNRTAAAEINQRLTEVKIDDVPLLTETPNIATTFHKFALDTLKQADKNPRIISEEARDELIKVIIKQHTRFRNPLKTAQILQPTLPIEPQMLGLISQFINRAQQKYPGMIGFKKLTQIIKNYSADPQTKIFYDFALPIYQEYRQSLKKQEKIDFNVLMSDAAGLFAKISINGTFEGLSQTAADATRKSTVMLIHALQAKHYLLIDEYQDFSYLFLNLVNQLRKLCPEAHLFAVGDDWQAINRFAGSDCTYFLNFADFFSEDTYKINLVTNYRSDRKIVDSASNYMIKATGQNAAKITAFSKKSGKIHRVNYLKTRFDTEDIKGDALYDSAFQHALADEMYPSNSINLPPTTAAKLLKATLKIIKKHHKAEQILILHRHNFTSFPGLTLSKFYRALKQVTIQNYILTTEEFDQRVSWLTIHRSKGLEADVVIILEADNKLLFSDFKNNLFEIFGDNHTTNREDQYRLYYVAITRAKHHLYLLTSEK
ncbi:ATP-dependent helicase [Candidatus Saccharibacteria bacterium]|nr:ATP-dependent helicase [Candidatus Saccharibacteria bacterium]